MRTDKSEMSFPVAYLIVLATQIPLWLCIGLFWALFMMLAAGSRPGNALIGGLCFALAMWLVCGNLFALLLAWRRSAEFSAPDRTAFRAALDRACTQVKLKVLAETPDELVLGPRWVLFRFRLQEARVVFDGSKATITGPAMSLGALRRSLTLALAETPDGRQKS